MRNPIILVAVLVSALVSTDAVRAQTQQQIQAQVQQLKAQAKQAASVFLDVRRAEPERLAAARKFSTFYDEAQVALCVKVARSPRESGAIRAVALSKISPYVKADTLLLGDILRWVRDAKTPPALREEALAATQRLSFSFTGMVQARDQILSALRILTADPDLRYREVAFGILASHGDDYAQRLLIDGLEDPGKALLPPEKSVGLLGLALHGDFYPTLYKVMLEPPNEETRVESIRLLGGYAPARETIVGYLSDESESGDVRMAAAGTLNANDPEEFASTILPFVADEGAPDDVRVYGIQAELFRRAARTRPRDSFDRVVRALAETSSSELVKRVARSYVEKVLPR